MPPVAAVPLEIVLVEDNRLNLELARTVLELDGHSVLAMKDGSAFRAYLKGGSRPDVVVLDIMLTDANGADLLKEMRACPHMNGIKAMAVTAHAFTGEAERLRTVGFDAVLTKPIDTRRFASQVAELAHSSRRDVGEKPAPSES